jgi:hypothetical protein
MAKANRANSPISTAVAAVLAVPGGAPDVAAADSPSTAPGVAATDTTVAAPIVTATDTAAAAPIATATDVAVDEPAIITLDTSVDTPIITDVYTPVDKLVIATLDTWAAPVVPVKVRVLAHCGYGKPNDIIQVDPALVESLKDVVDATPAAVAYAESLSD